MTGPHFHFISKCLSSVPPNTLCIYSSPLDPKKKSISWLRLTHSIRFIYLFLYFTVSTCCPAAQTVVSELHDRGGTQTLKYKYSCTQNKKKILAKVEKNKSSQTHSWQTLTIYPDSSRSPWKGNETHNLPKRGGGGGILLAAWPGCNGGWVVNI